MSKLKHFEEAQEGPLGYETALAEIRSGRKQSDWMLYIFPRLKGLERGFDTEYYGIESLYEARQYMEFGELGRRLRDITYAVLMHDTMLIEDIMDGWEDAERFRASMTLFDIICPGEYFGVVWMFSSRIKGMREPWRWLRKNGHSCMGHRLSSSWGFPALANVGFLKVELWNRMRFRRR